MGLTIDCDDDAPIPCETTLTLVCDAGGCGGLFGPVSASWQLGGYAENIAAAKRAGWRESVGSNGRLFLCPGCSGKRPHERADEE